MTNNPKGAPNLAHSELLILSFPAEIIFGMLPGINIPPAIKSPIKADLICKRLILGPISAAVKVALSTIAESIFNQ